MISTDQQKIFNLYIHGYSSLPDHLEPQKTLGITIPKCELNENHKKWNDIKETSPYYHIVELLFECLDHRIIGGSTWTNEKKQYVPYFFAPEKPKFLMAVEVLTKNCRNNYTAMDNKDFCGYRLWLIIFDPQLDINNNIEKIIKQPKKPEHLSNVIKNIDSSYEFGKNICFPYISEHKGFKQHDLTDYTDFTDFNDILQPYYMFHPSVNENVCADQADINRYINVLTGSHLFKGEFPHRDYVFRIVHNFASSMFNNRTPNSLFVIINQNKKDIKEMQDKISILTKYAISDNPEDSEQAMDDLTKLQKKCKELEDDYAKNLRDLTEINESGGLFNVSDSVLEILSQTNAFLTERLANTKIMDNIFLCYPDIRSKEHVNAKLEARQKAIKKFERIFMTSDKVSKLVKTTRTKYLNQLNAGEFFWDELCYWKNLTPFGNMISKCNDDLNRIDKLQSHYPEFWIGYGTALNSLTFTKDLRVNMLFTGDPSVGKSHIVHNIEKRLIEGSITYITHETKNRLNTEDPTKDVTTVYEEHDMQLFGIDNKGRVTAADPELKNRLTTGVIEISAYDTDPDVKGRHRKNIVVEFQTALILLTNERTPPRDTPIMQRFIWKIMKAKINPDRLDLTKISNIHNSVSVETEKIADASWKLKNAYQLIVEKAIESKAISDVNMDAFEIVCGIVFSELQSRGVKYPSIRKILQLRCLCRVFSILYANHMHYFSELGIDNRRDNEGRLKKFSFDSLNGLVKWLICTTEIVIFCFCLMEQTFTPIDDIEVIEAISRMIKFPMVDLVNNELKFRRVERENSNEIITDYRYIQLSKPGGMREIAQDIVKELNNKISEEDIIGILSGLTTLRVTCRPRSVQVYSKNQNFLKKCCRCSQKIPEDFTQISECKFCTRKIHNSCVEIKCILQSERNLEIRKNNKKKFCIRCKYGLKENENDPILDRCKQCHSLVCGKCVKRCSYSECTILTCSQCLVHCQWKECKKLFHSSCLKNHQDFIPDKSLKEEVIPAAFRDSFKTRTQKQVRFCVCVDLLDIKGKDILKESFKALEHTYINEIDAITCFPLVECDNETTQERTFYHYFDTINLRKNLDKKHYIINSNAPLKCDDEQAKLRGDYRTRRDDKKTMLTIGEGTIDQDIDYICQIHHAIKEGVMNFDFTKVTDTKKLTWEIRDKPCYKHISLIKDEGYPEKIKTYIKEQRNTQRKLKERIENNESVEPIFLNNILKKRKISDADDILPMQMDAILSITNSNVPLTEHPVEPDVYHYYRENNNHSLLNNSKIFEMEHEPTTFFTADSKVNQY